MFALYYLVVNRRLSKLNYIASVFLCLTGPKPSTVDDFWCMIWQENVFQIVMLTNLKEGTRVINPFVFLVLWKFGRKRTSFLLIFVDFFFQKKCAKYWSDLNAENDNDVFIINTLEEKQYANYVIRKIQMTNTQVINLFYHKNYIKRDDNTRENKWNLWEQR